MIYKLWLDEDTAPGHVAARTPGPFAPVDKIVEVDVDPETDTGLSIVKKIMAKYEEKGIKLDHQYKFS